MHYHFIMWRVAQARCLCRAANCALQARRALRAGNSERFLGLCADAAKARRTYHSYKTQKRLVPGGKTACIG